MKFTTSARKVFLGCCVAVTVGLRDGMGWLYVDARARQSAARGALDAVLLPH
jgi:hypothetical protein